MSAHDTPEVGSGETVGAACPWCHYGDPHPTFTTCPPASPDPVQPADAGEGLNTPPPAAGDVEHDIWWGYLCPALANIGALKDAQQEFVALGTDWAEAGRILSRVQRFYVDAAHDAARRYDAAREAAWAEKYAAVVSERDTAEQERDDWRYCAEGLAARAESAEAALATALREKAEDRARVEAVEALGMSWVGFDNSHPYGDAVLTALGGHGRDDAAEWLMGEVESRLDAIAEAANESELRWMLGEWLTEIKRAALAIPTATGDETNNQANPVVDR